MRNFIKGIILIFLLCFVVSCGGDKTANEYINAGIKFTEEQKYDKAISSFKNAIKLEPDNALAHYTLGGIYTFNDMNEDAAKEYKKAIELDSNYPDPHYSLGFVYQKLGREADAQEEFAKFKELKGN